MMQNPHLCMLPWPGDGAALELWGQPMGMGPALSLAVQGAGLFSGALWLTGHPGTGCMPLSWGVLGLMMENLADNPNCSYAQTTHFARRSDLEVILACTEMCVNEACSHSAQELSRNPGLKQA